MAPSSDLLDHYKLDANQIGDSVIHYSYRSDRACGHRKLKVEERWDNVRPIGYGAFGEVWQQKRKSSNEQRAVKVLRKQQMKSWGINYEREIEALAKFDKAEVSFSFVQIGIPCTCLLSNCPIGTKVMRTSNMLITYALQVILDANQISKC